MYWVAYKGKDTRGEIRVFKCENRAEAERMQVLLQGPVEVQDGRMSSIYEADTEQEALRLAPYKF